MTSFISFLVQRQVSNVKQPLDRGAEAPDLVERFAKDDVELVGSTPEEFRVHVAAEIKRSERIVKAAGLKLD